VLYFESISRRLDPILIRIEFQWRAKLDLYCSQRLY